MDPEFFHALQASAIAQAIAKSNHLVGAALQVVHILGLLLLLASVLLVGLRAFGLGLPRIDPVRLLADTRRLFWVGLIVAAASGGLIFLSSAVRYSTNDAFDLKVVLIVAALAAQVLAHRLLARQPVAGWIALRASATLSLLLWFGAAGAGRAIGYI